MKNIKLTTEEYELLNLVLDDWLVTNFESNVDYADVEKLSKKITE